MSVTPCPNPDRFDPGIQTALNRVIQAAFGGAGIDSFESDAGRIYSAERKRPLVCALMEETLVVGWLGNTHWQIAEKLAKTKDRAWVSRARLQGRISIELFFRLWFHPDRPKNSVVTEERLRPSMNRSASIGICRAIARCMPFSHRLMPEALNELNYELGCAVVDSASPWDAVRRLNSAEGAIEIVKHACGLNNIDVIPSWYTEIGRRQANAEISRLMSDGRLAFDRLNHLSQNWTGVLTATAELMESILAREAGEIG